METKSIERLHLLHPAIRDIAIDAYNEAVAATPAGVHPYIDETYRSFEESDRLYAQGRTTAGEIVSKARGGSSFHNYGCALDFHLIINGEDSWKVDHNWMVVVNIFKAHGFEWGGDWKGSFKDYPHLQMTMGYTWKKLLAKHNNKEYIKGTQYVNLT